MFAMHAEESLFVGRRKELGQIKEALALPQGQAILVVGQAGMGKTMLVNRIARCAMSYPDLKCGVVRYEVTRSDSVGTTLRMMMDHAFEAAQIVQGSLTQTDQSRKQWHALMKLLPKGSELVELIESLRHDPLRNPRDQFIERLKLISRRLPKEGRAVFIIDPEKYMPPDSQDDWRLVVRDMPDRIKFIFAQRPEDVLAASNDFRALGNVLRIPNDQLDRLDDEDVEELLELRSPYLQVPLQYLRAALSRYNGHAYAVRAALDLLMDGQSIEDLPVDPTPERIADSQWNHVCDRHGEQAMQLLGAYAVFDEAMSDEDAEFISDLTPSARRVLMANPYLSGLLREEQAGRRIYHSLLADHIRTRLSLGEKSLFRARAAGLFPQLAVGVRCRVVGGSLSGLEGVVLRRGPWRVYVGVEFVGQSAAK